MSKKTFPAVILPLLVALALMSLPEKFNFQLRDCLAERSLFLSRWISRASCAQCPKRLESTVSQWLHSQYLSQLQIEHEAKEYAPFSVLFDAPEKQYVVAAVLYRNHNRYNSSLWINIGSQTSTLIAKNSPVLSGDSVVGVIDYVGKRASCVRLISDSGLTPAVRTARGAFDMRLALAYNTILKSLEENKIHFKNPDEQKAFVWLLSQLQQEQSLPKEPLFLAKGILQGHGEPLWKAEKALLKGFGFNYDFKDQHGPARDLRTGDPIDPQHEYTPRLRTAIVKVGDLLVTSGMDGIFPEGLKVATVHAISPLTEGAFAYELTASPTAEDLLDLHYVTVLPPQGFDESLIPDSQTRLLDQLNN